MLSALLNRCRRLRCCTQKAEAVAPADRPLGLLVAVADYRGITVEQVDGLRRALEKEGVEYRVIKNTLAKGRLPARRWKNLVST